MKRIIIFRFDRSFDVCLNRLKLLKKQSPEIPIYGIYGGKAKEIKTAKKVIGKYFSNLYYIQNQTPEWKWKNFDFVLQGWYKKVGYKIDFDTAYIAEWDLVLLKPIAELYKHIKKNEVGLSGLMPLAKISPTWFWTAYEPYKTQYKKLFVYAKKKFHYKQKPYGCICPGLVLPKIFLEKYSKITVPQLVHDEIRIPLFAQIFGLKLKDTGFLKTWFDQKEDAYFNSAGLERLNIKLETIKSELKNKNGRRAFHPFRNNLPLNLV